MVGGKDGFEQPREVAEEWFARADFPVVGDIDIVARLLKRPDATPDEVAPGFEGEAVRVGVGDPELPAQGVGKPAFGVQINNFPDARLGVTGFQFFDRKVDGRPPAREVGAVAEDCGDFLDGGVGEVPVGGKVVVVGCHELA